MNVHYDQLDITPVWLRGDDSHYVRSKYLDRDIDIVMKSLNTMVTSSSRVSQQACKQQQFVEQL